MTHGDNSSIKCPSCKKPIFNPIGRDEPQRGGGIVEKTINCPHCITAVHLWARWSITIEAEKESKVK